METYARVFPLPVTASTTTSEFFINMGIAACCTGVVFTKPMESTASSIHSERAGVKAPKERSTLLCGAMCRCYDLDGFVVRVATHEEDGRTLKNKVGLCTATGATECY